MKASSVSQLLLGCLIISVPAATLVADDWANWRGPQQNGISTETGLVGSWSLEPKENVLWSSEIGGRATPIVLNDRVYLNCRTNHDFNDPDEKIHCREQVVCRDAKTGNVLWRDEFNVFQTDIASPRVGWAAMCGDAETNTVFVHSVSGIFRCYNAEGEVQWEHSLLEEYGKISGYGGRTQTPIIEGDLVIVSFMTTNWGATKAPPPKQTYYAFDKRSGALQWASAPGGAPKDTNYSVPVVAEINGQRLLIGGNSDGGVYAIKAATGEKVWGFQMSRRGLNSSPVVDGNYVYISHGEDNVDNSEFGRVQCIDATGTGDVTRSHSVWNRYGVKAGYTGMLVKDGILYVVADTGNMYAFDSKSGDLLWEHNLGTVGKGSPVWADGKIYVMEVNGNILILKPSRDGCETISHVHLDSRNGSGADEIYASPAISNGRVFFVTRDRTICIGQKEVSAGNDNDVATTGRRSPNATSSRRNQPDEEISFIQLRPYEVILDAGGSVDYELHAFNSRGRFIKKIEPELTASVSLTDIKINGAAVTANPSVPKANAGTVSAKMGDLVATARIRVFPSTKTWKWDFEEFTERNVPPTWIRAFAVLTPVQVDGSTAMRTAPGKGRPSHAIWIGTPDMKDYTIQADVMLREQRRKLSSVGITANRYNFILKANNELLSLQSWAPHLRMAKEIDFEAEPDVWYTMKMAVDVNNGVARVKGKIWKRSESEPEDWTIEAEDPHPNENGSPGLYMYRMAECFYDNVIVTQND